MKKILSALLVFVIITTTSLLSESYLCFQNFQSVRMCKCNHSSEKELHTTSSQILLPEHSDLFKSSVSLPSCHSSKGSAPHICSCKKNENTLGSFLLQKSLLFLSSVSTLIYTPSLYFSHIPNNVITLSSGYNRVITPPPKSTSI